MADLRTNVRYIHGVGEQRAKALTRLGIETLWDLISYFPRRYEDRTQTKRIAELHPEERVCVSATVASDPTVVHIRRGLDLLKLRAVDETGSLDITFFNQTWLKDTLQPGRELVFFGKVDTNRHQMVNPIVEPAGKREFTGRIVPVYALTAGVSQLTLSRAIRQGLDECSDILPDTLPDEVRQAHKLCRIEFAFQNIHFPENPEALALARRRLAFEELFLYAVGLKNLRAQRKKVKGPACGPIDLSAFYSGLPFTLTGAQQRCVEEALRDMHSGYSMHRLCQGDVGSGKTMVAAACVYFIVRNGWQAALMAPTEILAQQHFSGLASLLEPLGIRCAVLTGSARARQRREVVNRIADGTVDFVIGTHALLSRDVAFHNLGLVVTDEQHRFGVAQRAALSEKGRSPHMLVMSATPIPRTLALILYGDLDISVLDELPPGRQPVDTFAVSSAYHPRIYQFLRNFIAQGRQAYIVCPTVDENGDLSDERKAVKTYAQHLQSEIFPDLNIACIHGKMSAREKDAVMSSFVSGTTDILVATSVIEVGVDVPNAVVIVIENAERFGLSQLHQLRGRVGRGSWKSYCILISDHQNEETCQRLKIMTQTGDGFKIAEEDLRLRGPGDFFGERQHGLPDLKISTLGCDTRLAQEAQLAAEEWLAQDPDLVRSPATRARITELFHQNANAMN